MPINYAADPDTSYRFAKGQPVVHPYSKTRIQIGTPLDFLVVSDHAEFMGFIRAIIDGTANLSDLGPINSIKRWFIFRYIRNAIENDEGPKAYKDVMPQPPKDESGNPILDSTNPHVADPAFGDPTPTVKNAWAEILERQVTSPTVIYLATN